MEKTTFELMNGVSEDDSAPFPSSGARRDVDLVEQVVLRAFNLELHSLRLPSRGRAEIALARQVAIYVLHVHLGLSLTASARAFGRDRTTAAHACQKVEDSRDSRRFDRVLSEIETAIERWSLSAAVHPAFQAEGTLQ
jgi:chromosomal replication initiation ATPase DnaA